jgi:RNA polymerase sigma-70 factor (ECF subfamily)
MTQPSAGEASWERYRASLAVLARLRVDPRLRDRLDLSGIVQQTLLEAHLAGDRWAGAAEGQRLVWLKKALVNNLADELRKLAAGKRDLDREQPLAAAAAQSSVRLQEWLAAEQSSPSEQAVRHEQELALADALNQLPDDQREALILQHWHGWSLADIGAALNRSPAAVAGLIKRGLAKLRTRIQQANDP